MSNYGSSNYGSGTYSPAPADVVTVAEVPILATAAGAAIPKLEARHVWQGTLALNDLDAWPRFKLSKITGLGSLGDTDDQRTNRQGRRGENVRPALRRGKTVGYEGTIRARTLLELRNAELALLSAFDPLTYGGALEGQMETLLHDDYVANMLGGGNYNRTFKARPLSCIVVEEQAGNGWDRPFAVTLRLSDPRVFFSAEIALVQSPGTAGNSSVAVVNPGRADADPILEVIGPTNAAWSVENTTLARSLKFAGFALAAGQTAVIDFTDRTIKLAGADQSAKLDLAQSDWWDRDTPGLAPGANTITLQPGAGATTATRVGVRYHRADPA